MTTDERSMRMTANTNDWAPWSFQTGFFPSIILELSLRSARREDDADVCLQYFVNLSLRSNQTYWLPLGRRLSLWNLFLSSRRRRPRPGESLFHSYAYIPAAFMRVRTQEVLGVLYDRE